jgi:hypothetical protein
MSSEEYSTESARTAAEHGRLGDWVARFLCSPGSDNCTLGELLSEERRFWFGPVQVPLDQLHRLAGPPGAPVLQAVPEEYWRDDVEDLARRIARGFEPPPVIVSHRDCQLMLEDGNHRVEALRRAGVKTAWAVIGFDTPEDRDAFVAENPNGLN